MSDPVTLTDAKLYLRVEDTDEDTLITNLIAAATERAENFLKRPIPWQDDDGNDVDVPASVQAAILLFLGDLYNNREASFVGVAATDNQTALRLLWPYRQLEVQ